MRTKPTSRLKTPLWLGALVLLTGCVIWAGLNALTSGEPDPPQSALLTLEDSLQSKAPTPLVSATPQPEAALTPEPSRVPVLEDVGGWTSWATAQPSDSQISMERFTTMRFTTSKPLIQTRLPLRRITKGNTAFQ